MDVRVIAATNKDLKKEISAGNFREDLFFRLNVIPIFVPALRDRGTEDLVSLIAYFMNRYKSQETEAIKGISEEGMKHLLNYSWPGNIRELKNFIERINIMTDDDVISAEVVKYYLGENQTEKRSEIMKMYENLKLNDARDKFEKMFITDKLKAHGYNISQTAGDLGIYPSNLHGKIKKLGIEIKK